MSLYAEYGVGLGWALLVLLAAVGLGTPVLRKLVPTEAEVPEKLTYSLGSGLGILGIGAFLLGHLGWLDRPLAGVAVVLASFHGARMIWRSRPVAVSLGLRGPRLWLAATILILATLGLAGSLAPPSYSDTMRHYLAAPKFYLQAGRASFQPVLWWNLPGLGEALLYLSMVVVGERGAVLLTYAWSLLPLLPLYLLGSRLGGPTAGWLAAALFYAMPTVVLRAVSAKSDLLMTFYGLAAFLAVSRYLRHSRPPLAAVAGLMAGMAFASKAQGAFAVVAMALVVLLGVLVRRTSQAIASLSLFGLMALLPVAPWLVRNSFAGGDPLWPLLSFALPDQHWSSYQTAKFASWQTPTNSSPLDYVLGLWRITMDYPKFGDVRVPASPIFLAALPGLMLSRTRGSGSSSVLWVAGLLALVWYSLWFATFRNESYLVPAWAALAVAASAPLNWMIQRPGLVRFVGGGAVAAALALGLGVSVLLNARVLPVVLGFQPKQTYLEEQTSYYREIVEANKLLGPSDRVLVLPLYYYYFEVPWLVGAPAYQGYFTSNDYKSAEGYLARLRQLGITHIFVDTNRITPLADHLPAYPDGRDPLTAVLEELEAKDILVPVQMSDDARVIESRTLKRWSPTRVVLYRVVAGRSSEEAP